MNNNLKTVILLGALSGLLLFIGKSIGGSQGLFIAFLFSLLMNGYAYFFSDKIVLRMYNAKPLDQQRYAGIYHMVAELCRKMNIPTPKLWMIDNPSANAFATGRNPSHASVAFTSSILQLLDERELRGVVAHELSHVKNRDTLISTIAVVIATTISYLAQMLQYSAMWQTNSQDGQRRSNPLSLLVLAIITPFIASLLQLAISRSREYMADETGAHVCHDPLALASALEKLHTHIAPAGSTTQATTSSLFIVHPFRTSTITEWFATHPPLRKRVERLRKMAQNKNFDA